MDSRKPLGAGDDARQEVATRIDGNPVRYLFAGFKNVPFGEYYHAEDYQRLLAMLQPPPDAAVREAVERLDNSEYTISLDGSQDDTKQMWEDIDTLIAHARAAQAPRLTPEQVEAVRDVVRKTESRQCICGDGYLCARCEILGDLRAAFPGAFAGEVGHGE